MADSTNISTIQYVSALRWAALKREFVSRQVAAGRSRDQGRD
ncbi:hypothetical protein [Cryobacterium fucosi]|nr:hypothetical protein [Cryobacterium fucosi]